MNKKVKLTVTSVCVAAILGVGFYGYTQKVEHDKYVASVNSSISKIENEVKQASVVKLSAGKNTNETTNLVNQSKLNELKKLQKDLKDYKNGKEAYKPVIDKYNEEIKALQKYFKDINQTAVDKLVTTKDALDKNNDKAKLQDSSKQLDAINNTIKSEINVVYSTKEAKTIQDKIASMQKLYQDRIKAIEAKEKADAEAKAKAEAAKAKAETGNDAAVGYNAQGQAVDAGGNVVQNYNQTNGGGSSSSGVTNYDGGSNGSYSGSNYSGGSGNYSGGSSYSSGSGSYSGSTGGSTGNSEVHPPENWTWHGYNTKHWGDPAHGTYTTEDENGLHAYDGYGNDLGGGISFGN